MENIFADDFERLMHEALLRSLEMKKEDEELINELNKIDPLVRKKVHKIIKDANQKLIDISFSRN